MSRKSRSRARPARPKHEQTAVASLYDPPVASVTRQTEAFICLALAAVTVVAYYPVFSNGFVNLDDDYYVYRNDSVTAGLQWPAVKWAFTTMFLGNWHPLTWISLQIDSQLFGLNAIGYHATNLALHTANTLALFWMLKRLTGAVQPSAFAAALFALHPLHVESVAWVTERKDVLSTLFFFLAIITWQRYVTIRTSRIYVLSVVLLICSLLSKVMGVSFPLVLLLLDFWPMGRAMAADNRRTLRGLLIEKLPLVAVCIVFSIVAMVAQRRAGAMGYGESLSFIERWRLIPVNYVAYLAKTFWPVDLAVLYPHPGADLPLWKPVAAAALLVAITAVCWLWRNSRPYLIVGWAWFLVTLLPVIGIVQVGLAATADRYMYLPMAGLLIMVCWAAAELAGTFRRLKPVLAVVCPVTLAVCGWLTFRQAKVWHDSGTLWQHALATTRPTFISCNNYALALEQSGNIDEAEHWYRKAIEIDPENFYPNCNLGVILSKKGNQDEAAMRLKIALRSQPDNALLLENLGVVEELRGDYDAAIDYYQRSAQLNTRSPKIYQHLQRVLAKQKSE